MCVCVFTCSRECCPVCHYLPVTGCRMWSIDCSAGTSQSSSLSRVHAVSSPGLLHNYRVSHTVMFTASLSICLYHVPVSWLLRSGLRPPNSPLCARRASQTRGHTRYVTRGSALDSVRHRVYTGNCTVEMLQPSLVSNHPQCYPCAWVAPRDRATLARVLGQSPRVRAFRQLAHGNNDHSVCTLNLHIISQSTSLTRLPSTSITTVALSPTLEGLRLTDVSFCFRSSLSIPGSCTRHWPLQQVIFHLNITLHQLPLETQPSLVHHGSPRRRQVQVRQPRKRPSITLSPRQSEAIGAICIVSVGQISSADTHLHP